MFYFVYLFIYLFFSLDILRMVSVVENSPPLDDKIDDIMTRLSLFEMRYPITMNALHNRLVQSEQKVDVANVIEENFVPSEDMIKVWKMQISTNAAEITEKGFVYIPFPIRREKRSTTKIAWRKSQKLTSCKM